MEMTELDRTAREWRIESWSVLDGIAFATEWQGDEREPRIAVYLSPPYWRPVTVANRATTLRATRGPFQEGFFDDEGMEIAFASLEELIEVVRRAYLGGGFGSITPPEGAAPIESGGAGRGPGQTDSEVVDEMWPRLHRLLPFVVTTIDRADLAREMGSLVIKGLDSIRQLGENLAMDILAPARGSAALSRQQDSDLLNLAMIAARFVGPGYTQSIGHEFWPFGPYIGWPSCPETVHVVLDGLLFRLPYPDSWQRGTRFSTLGDQLALALASRDYLKTLNKFDQFFPILFMAACVTAASYPLARSSRLSLPSIEVLRRGNRLAMQVGSRHSPPEPPS